MARAFAAATTFCLLLFVPGAHATSMGGLPAGGAVSGTDTMAICQKPTGCASTDPLHQISAAQLSAYLLRSPILSMTTPAFYVASTGSDSNDGSRQRPFATLGRCHTAMTSSLIKVCFIRAGTIALTASFTPGSGETYAGYPGDAPQSATIDTTGIASGSGIQCTGGANLCSNITFENLTLNGTPSAGFLVYFTNSFNNLRLLGNIIHNTRCSANKVLIQLYNGNNLYVQGNTILGCAAGSGGTADSLGDVWNNNAASTGVWITDNVIDGCNRFCVELQTQGSATVDNIHIDRNTWSNFDGGATGGASCTPTGSNAIAALSDVAATTSAGTIWGNSFIALASDSSCTWAVELAAGNTSVEYNQLNYTGTAFIIGVNAGTEIQNNTILLSTTGVPTSWGTQRSFDRDGGYNNSEWIGNNTVNGSLVSGCPNSGAAAYCGLGFNGYGAPPAVHQASSVYPPG